jgi:translation initiation factor 2-alpha kinase 4
MWHILTQILEGLAYVHKSGIVHRDLKPDNIFIADGNKVKIGDFGLARPGEMNLLPTNRDVNDPGGQGHHSAASAGTHFYMAPELRTFVAGKYDQKVDMYAMGIILFEMNYRFGSDAERYHLLTQVRTKAITLPKEMQLPDKANQAQIITTLLTHEPKERPSSMEVLEGGLIPTYIVNDPTRNTVETITTDPKIMEVVFDHQAKHGFTTAQNYNFDDDLKMAHGETLRAKMNVKEILTAVFRRHGALESERSILLPPSDFEKDKAAVRLMTIGGRVVQLPHDLTLPNARILAKNKNLDRHTFTFGHTYRHVAGNMHPTTYGEVNYNLVSLNGLDLALREAEIFKVVDELSEVFPIFDRKSVVININHANILDAMMKYSEIPEDKWAVVKNLLGSYSHLPTQQSKLRTTLREPGIDLSSENVDKLMKFDFRGPLEEAMKKIRNILGEISQELDPTFRHLEALWTYAKRFQVRSTLYICPFSAVNHELYGGNMLFQCLDESSKQKMLIAVGGRYDRLVQEHRAGTQNADCHVVGFQMDWENIVNTWQNLRSSEAKVGKKVKQYYRDEEQVTSLNRIPKRCEVLVDSYHANILRTMGIDIVQELWMANISAELVIDSEIPEGQSGHSQGKDEQYNYVVNLKQDDTLKVRDLAANEEESMRHAELVPWLQAQIRERERLAGHAPPSRAPQSRAVQDTELGQSVVHVLQAQTKSKKFNRAKVEKEAQAALRESTQALSSAPILAVEMNKELFEALRSTRFGDAESWKKFVQSAPVDTRKYLGDLHGDLQQKAAEMKVGNKLCFLFNFRSKASIVIDLGGETK